MTNEDSNKETETGNQTPSITINTGTEVVTRELTANELKALSGGSGEFIDILPVAVLEAGALTWVKEKAQELIKENEKKTQK